MSESRKIDAVRAGNRGKGRPKGSPNKVTADVRSAILAAFDKVGGADYLVKQADKNPQAFLTLLGKCVPAQVAAEITGKLEVTHIRRSVVDPRHTDA